jgi:hypothetical protein
MSYSCGWLKQLGCRPHQLTPAFLGAGVIIARSGQAASVQANPPMPGKPFFEQIAIHSEDLRHLTLKLAPVNAKNSALCRLSLAGRKAISKG